jgi:trk system potassium uptake protein TrkH
MGSLFGVGLTPPRLLAGSFLILIFGGTVGLKVLPGLYVGAGLSWTDALFTAASAVCVTGLIVVDTATYFTPFGQAFLLLLIQLGGLGILTFTTILILAIGRRVPLRHQEAMSHPSMADVDVRSLVKGIVTFTLIAEALGAALLFLLWRGQFGAASAAWHAAFHAVSAFCNAGFSTFSDSLVSFRSSWSPLLVIMTLVVVGGIGFLTLMELRGATVRRAKHQRWRFSLHTRLALVTTLILIVGGTLLFTALEWNNVLGGLAASHRWLNGLFMSVTARTAGFNTIDYGRAEEGTNVLTILLMSIGGSPGSTAGGLKTTTVAVIAVVALSRLRGRRDTSVMGRTIPEETVQRAVALWVVAGVLMACSVLLLSAMELGPSGHHGGFLHVLFEVSSAFNTVGLTMGSTTALTGPGRVVTAGLMYLGRVGPLTIAAALAADPTPGGEIRFASEDVIVG